MALRTSLEALVGSTLVVAPPDGWVDGPQDWLDELQPAGVILFKRNLPDDVETARAAIARLHAWAVARGETLLVCADEEGGFVTQTSAWIPTPPSARALAWAGAPEGTRGAFAMYGARLRALGINLDFAPVCDVNNNPQNPVIGVRSFGGDPDGVTAHALAVHQGLRDAGVLSCAKHFPGHGDTDIDSHLALPVVQHDRERFERLELVPFRALLPQVPVVMVAHLACPGLGGGMLPATLAPEVATDLLRRDLRFEGVAITDAMDMQGVAGQFGVEDAAVRALLAGCDLLLYCFEIDKPRQARKALLAAVQLGRVPRARLEQAAARVERLRALAAAAADTPQRASETPAAEAEHYRQLCRQALRVPDPAGWRALSQAARMQGKLALTGWPAELVQRLASRLPARGLEAVVHDPEMAQFDAGTPLVVVLGERRPLAPERVALLRQWAASQTPIGLANLLTPEIDTPLVESFTSILRSADTSDAMLDVVADRLVDAPTA
jgi:beta-N-acetylhexosaminidase